MEDEAVQTSTAVFLAEGAKLAADGLVDGDGGKLIVWSDEMTVTAADISARGGALSGNGGFIETSGSYLQVEKAADASATNGLEGTWLLDPTNITIDRSGTNSLWTFRANEFFNTFGGGGFLATSFRPTANTSVLSANLIESALNNGSNVVVSTFDTPGTASGDIRIRTDITKTSGGNARLSILAGDDITIDPGVDIVSRSGSLLIELWAAFGSIVGTGAGRFDTNGGELMLTARDGINFSSTFNMPDNLSINLNNDGIGSSLKQVDVRFDGDRVRFGYSASNLELTSGAISLLDTNATGALYLRFLNAMNVHLYDRSIVGITDRSWEIGPTASASVPNASKLNGIPEIEGFANVTWAPGAEPGAGYVPVIEVSTLRDGTADAGKYIVTAPSGNAALSAYLARPTTVLPVQVVVNQALNPNINVQAALDSVKQLPGLSCQLGAAQCVVIQETANATPAYKLATLLSSDSQTRSSQTSKLAQNYLTQAFQTGTYAGYIAPSFYLTPDYSVLIKECVSLTRAIAGLGATSTWKKGISLTPNSAGSYPDIPVGTPLATFDPANGSYNGSTGKTSSGQWQHTGIFLGYITDASGDITGMSMLDQYQISGSKPAGVSNYYFNDKDGTFLRNASNYSVVN